MSEVKRCARRIAFALASGAVLAVLLPAAPALAVTAGGIDNGGTYCAAGQQVTGGGAAVVGEGSADFNTRIEGAAAKSHLGKAFWATTIRNADGVAHQIGRYSVCVNSVAGYQVASTDLTVGAGGFLRSVATCPAGTVVLGGGAADSSYSVTQLSTVDRIVQESSPGASGSQSVWLTALRNNDSVAHVIKLFAVCATSPAGYQVVHTEVTLAAGGFVRDTARCPAGAVALNGGAAVTGSGSGDFKIRIQETAPATVGGQSSWLTAVRNNDSVAHTISLYAVCASPPTGYQVVRADV